jgi:hypothetical protein
MITKIIKILIFLLVVKNLFAVEKDKQKEVSISKEVSYELCLHGIHSHHEYIKLNSEIGIETYNLYISNKEYRDVGTKYHTFYISAFIEYFYENGNRKDGGEEPYYCFIEKEYNIKNGVRIVIFKNGKRIMFDIIDEKYIQQWNQYFKGILSNSKNQ